MTEDNSEFENINGLSDQILENIKSSPFFSKVDPLRFNIDYKNIKLKRGKITGISSVYRSGDSYLSMKNSPSVKGNISLTFPRLKYQGQYKVWTGIVWLKGQVAMRWTDLKVKVEFYLKDFTFATVESITITNSGDCKIEKISGVTPVFNWLLKLYLNQIVQTVKESAIKSLESELVTYANEALKNMLMSKL